MDAHATTTLERQALDALFEAGLALSRAITFERVLHEGALLARRALSADAVVIALAEADGAPAAATNGARAEALAVAHRVGFDEAPATIATRLRPAWGEALALGRPVLRDGGDGVVELTAPVSGAGGVLGAITVRTDRLDSPPRLDEARRTLGAVAAQVAAAVERARLVRRAEHRQRLAGLAEVAAGVAQELRAPVLGIASAAQLLRYGAGEDPVLEKNVGRILREAERLNRIAASLLEYGRPHPLRLAPGDPDAVWDDVLDAERGRLESAALQLARTRAEPPRTLPIDAEQLALVFQNVLVNAVEASPAESDLTLVASALPDGGWRCTLRNGGPPILPDALPRVFDLFFSTRAGRAGIGLALAQRIVEEHGGTIAIDSAPRTGTAATITLPGG